MGCVGCPQLVASQSFLLTSPDGVAKWDLTYEANRRLTMPASELNHPNGGTIQFFAIQKRHNCVVVEYLQQSFPIDHMNI